MLGASPGVAALGRGPSRPGAPRQIDYTEPAAGWGAAKSVAHVLAQSREPLAGPEVLPR